VLAAGILETLALKAVIFEMPIRMKLSRHVVLAGLPTVAANEARVGVTGVEEYELAGVLLAEF
jgi:hypothetical protein